MCVYYVYIMYIMYIYAPRINTIKKQHILIKRMEVK